MRGKDINILCIKQKNGAAWIDRQLTLSTSAGQAPKDPLLRRSTFRAWWANCSSRSGRPNEASLPPLLWLLLLLHRGLNSDMIYGKGLQWSRALDSWRSYRELWRGHRSPFSCVCRAEAAAACAGGGAFPLIVYVYVLTRWT